MANQEEFILLELARLEYVARRRKLENLIKLDSTKDINRREVIYAILDDIEEELEGIALEKEHVLMEKKKGK